MLSTPRPYDDCKPLSTRAASTPRPGSRVGEYHFDENQLGEAIAAYQQGAGLRPDKDNPYYDEALYKLAWTYYRADKFTEAIKQFDELVVYSDKELREDRQERLRDAARVDPVPGHQLRRGGLGRRHPARRRDGPAAHRQVLRPGATKEKHVYEVYKRLADIYFDTTKYDDAIKVYKLMLKRWPYRRDNPEIQDKVIMALERQRKFEEAIKEREEFTRLFGKGTEWERRNRNNPKALKKARDIDEQALIQAAVFHHKAAKTCSSRGLAMSDSNLLEQAGPEYALAAKAYEQVPRALPQHQEQLRDPLLLRQLPVLLAALPRGGQGLRRGARQPTWTTATRRRRRSPRPRPTRSTSTRVIDDGKLPHPDLPKATRRPSTGPWRCPTSTRSGRRRWTPTASRCPTAPRPRG